MVQSEHKTVDQIKGVASSLVGDREAWRRLLTEHVADASGHCRGCRLPTQPPPVWPCRLHAIGAEAQRLAADRDQRATSIAEGPLRAGSGSPRRRR